MTAHGMECAIQIGRGCNCAKAALASERRRLRLAERRVRILRAALLRAYEAVDAFASAGNAQALADLKVAQRALRMSEDRPLSGGCANTGETQGEERKAGKQ